MEANTPIITKEELRTLGTELRKLDARIATDAELGLATPPEVLAQQSRVNTAYTTGALAVNGKAPATGSNMLPSGGTDEPVSRNWAKPNSENTSFLSQFLPRDKAKRVAEIMGFTGLAIHKDESPERRAWAASKLEERHGYKRDPVVGFINERLDHPNYVTERRAAAAEMSAFGGSALIPSTVLPELEALLLSYGTARQVSRNLDLPAGSVYPPIIRGYPKVVWQPELSTSAQTNSTNPVFGNYEMKPKTLMGINEFSNTLVEDAVVNYGDTLAEALIYTLQYGEDQAAFLGNAESGIVSIPQAFANVLSKFGTDYGTYTSTVAASKTDFTQIPLTDILQAAAKPRIFNNKPKFSIVCHPNFYIGCLLRLMAQGGGNTIFTLSKSPDEVNYLQETNPTFLIFPVVLSNSMPSAPASNATYFYIGDFARAMTFGTRSEISMLISNVADQAIYKNTSIIRVMERIDFNAHSVGGTSVDAGNNPIAGPIGRYVSIT